jgi:hypothetical protein
VEFFFQVETANVLTVVFTHPDYDVSVCGNAQDKLVPRLQARLGTNCGA